MNVKKMKLYVFELLFLVSLLFILFVLDHFARLQFSLAILSFGIGAYFLFHFRKTISLSKRDVSILVLALSVIFLVLYYMMGLYFGYYQSLYRFGFNTILRYIIPSSLIILSTEVIRSCILKQKDTFGTIIGFGGLVLVDLIVSKGVYDFTDFDDFLIIVGFIIFASIAGNLLCNYICNRFGIMPNIVLRIIMTIYPYVLSIQPNVYIFFSSFLRMLYPYLMFLVIESMFPDKNKKIKMENKVVSTVRNVVGITVSVLFIMLISCQFRYGLLVIATGSMTGTIDIGDAAFFESYHNQEISVGDIVIYESDGNRIIHRVIEADRFNGEMRYVTKGDANQSADDGYRTLEDIRGISKFKIKYIGYPTLWIRDIFNKK